MRVDSYLSVKEDCIAILIVRPGLMIDPFISDLLFIRLANFELDTAEAESKFRKLSGGR